MKRLLILICACLFICNASSQQLPAIEAVLATKSLLLDIVKVSDNQLIAVGERGHILFSEDAIDWRQANVPLRSTLTSVYFLDEKHGWAVGHDATILFSNDGGRQWQVQQYIPEKEKPLFDVVFENKNHGIAIGAYGQLYRTSDGGTNWIFEFHDEFLLSEDAEYLAELKQEDEQEYLAERESILPHFNRLFVDGNTLYLVGEVGLTAKSDDFGRSWQVLDEIYQGSFNDIIRTQQGSLLVVGLRGHVFRLDLTSPTWQQSQSSTQALLNSIVLANNAIYVLGNNGALLVSKDDGVTFSLINQPDGKALISGVWFNEQLIVVSGVGLKSISTTTDINRSTTK